MNNSIVSIIDLSDEILLTIFKKLDNFDVLYSLVGVNKKLDNVACDIDFTRSVDLMTISLNGVADPGTNAILDRFCMHILPHIHNKVECLTVEACFLHRVIHAGNYLNLRKLTLVNLQLSVASHIFNEKSPFINIFQHQISDLAVTISDALSNVSMKKSLIAVYDSIFVLLTDLKSLEFHLNDIYPFRGPLLTGLSSTKCFSSSIVYLRIKMHNIDDCLYLLDGRLSHLRTFIVNLDYIHEPTNIGFNPTIIPRSLKIINNAVKNYIQ
ncbi:unnamed protein product [Rotaria sp. Silwood2]|nr:unnamed protein product [Rotaria sp. Silwood2]CAF3199487.1 unnamed protein product [Rotaria sp. Silwood2]CAF3343063.1 unnamed protein product [Rotaria sp. Silwood2]CAF4245102.1 unnamed protein product [Rotaria sp. Silwood2]CAF4260341.1 unnamed protein product [Rotaria sp. Silwood2]